VVLEYGALKVLYGVCLAIKIGLFVELCGDGVALLGEAAVGLPVLAERAAQALAGLGELDARGVGHQDDVECVD
jgi:hypothetical protein